MAVSMAVRRGLTFHLEFHQRRFRGKNRCAHGLLGKRSQESHLKEDGSKQGRRVGHKQVSYAATDHGGQLEFNPERTLWKKV